MTVAELKIWLDGYMAGANDKTETGALFAKLKHFVDSLKTLEKTA